MTLSVKEISEYNKEGKRRCQGRCPDGSQYRKRAREGSDFCFSHSPETAEERREIARKGGQVTRRPVLPKAESLTPEKARELLSSCSELLLTGRISPGVARSLASIITCDKQMREHEILLKRIEALENPDKE